MEVTKMDTLLSPRLLEKLSFLGSASKHLLISYLTLLEARNYALSTLDPVVLIIKRLLLPLPQGRVSVITDDLSLTTSSDIDCFLSSASAKGLAPSTINISLSTLKEFFDFLREDGKMQIQPVIPRRHRLFAPITLPK